MFIFLKQDQKTLDVTKDYDKFLDLFGRSDFVGMLDLVDLLDKVCLIRSRIKALGRH